MPVGVKVTDALLDVLDVLLISVTPLTTVPGMATVNAAFAPVATGVYSVAEAVLVAETAPVTSCSTAAMVNV
ncbi:hypothetical protein E2I14_19185 [Sapientia aquatica]|uniref:Uncharacterized protein n=1 Tax=Sapientia aquatica TaxID=1549640 RepID=A0A4R5VKR2_9BURK|nr:hypothetical protein E2I14_19185 [Sapientia aquatica]